MWANHHGIFRLISTASHGLVVAKLFLCCAWLSYPSRPRREASPLPPR